MNATKTTALFVTKKSLLKNEVGKKNYIQRILIKKMRQITRHLQMVRVCVIICENAVKQITLQVSVVLHPKSSCEILTRCNEPCQEANMDDLIAVDS